MFGRISETSSQWPFLHLWMKLIILYRSNLIFLVKEKTSKHFFFGARKPALNHWHINPSSPIWRRSKPRIACLEVCKPFDLEMMKVERKGYAGWLVESFPKNKKNKHGLKKPTVDGGFSTYLFSKHHVCQNGVHVPHFRAENTSSNVWIHHLAT